MLKNNRNLELKIDLRGICTGDSRAVGYLRVLRREIFETDQELLDYFRLKNDGDAAKVLKGFQWKTSS